MDVGVLMLNILRKLLNKEEESPEVEFNNGFVTALTLFYGHREQFNEAALRATNHDLRIYAACDHLFDIQIPKCLSRGLKRKVRKFVKTCLSKRLERLSFEEGNQLFDQALELIKKIDKECFELDVVVNCK